MDIDCIVIGAGVVGLAVARELARAGLEVLVAEEADCIGSGTSSRNSEVIHAGIYYPTGSLKAKACREGRDLLYAYCETYGVPFKRCGKLIVSTSDEETEKLKTIEAKAIANGVHDLSWLTPAEVAAMEPEVRCVAAMLSPSTGIIDSHSYMLSLQGEIESHGGALAFLTPFEGATVTGEGVRVRFGGADPMELTCRYFVNSAGLGAQNIAYRMEGFPQDKIPKLHLAKGNYFTLQGRQPFSRPIYPAPVQGGLGVHVTLDLAGQCKFGPDVEWLDSETFSYEVDPRRADAFYAAIRRYWPGLPDGAITPGYSGVRPKIAAKGEPDGDFRIDGPAFHGAPGVVQMFGIESPGLTSSLALAARVKAALGV